MSVVPREIFPDTRSAMSQTTVEFDQNEMVNVGDVRSSAFTDADLPQADGEPMGPFHITQVAVLQRTFDAVRQVEQRFENETAVTEVRPPEGKCSKTLNGGPMTCNGSGQRRNNTIKAGISTDFQCGVLKGDSGRGSTCCTCPLSEPPRIPIAQPVVPAPDSDLSRRIADAMQVHRGVAAEHTVAVYDQHPSPRKPCPAGGGGTGVDTVDNRMPLLVAQQTGNCMSSHPVFHCLSAAHDTGLGSCETHQRPRDRCFGVHGT